MGRKLKVVETNKKHLTKAEKAVREDVQKKAGDGLAELRLTPPAHLGKIAKKEYKRVVSELQSLPIRDLDRAILENYCTWYGIYIEASEKVRLMYPYVQTTLTQMEIIKLQTEITRKGIKLVEFGSNRKDRYSALGYMNLFIREKENELKKPKNRGNFIDLW